MMPQVLKDNGYATVLIWGYTSPNVPNELGLDIFKGILGGMMDGYYTHIRMDDKCPEMVEIKKNIGKI